MQNRDFSFKCPLCFYQTTTDSDLTKHYLKNHKKNKNFSIKCTGCDSIYTNLKSFQKHVQRDHSQIELDDFIENLPDNNDDLMVPVPAAGKC